MLPGDLGEGLTTGRPQFFPRLDTIMVLLSRRVTAASAWCHILTINSFAARHVYLHAARYRLPASHSIALCLLAGPAGLACHMVTLAVARVLRRRSLRGGGSAARGTGTGVMEAGTVDDVPEVVPV